MRHRAMRQSDFATVESGVFEAFARLPLDHGQ
jgi:hypothetical protein